MGGYSRRPAAPRSSRKAMAVTRVSGEPCQIRRVCHPVLGAICAVCPRDNTSLCCFVEQRHRHTDTSILEIFVVVHPKQHADAAAQTDHR